MRLRNSMIAGLVPFVELKCDSLIVGENVCEDEESRAAAASSHSRPDSRLESTVTQDSATQDASHTSPPITDGTPSEVEDLCEYGHNQDVELCSFG